MVNRLRKEGLHCEGLTSSDRVYHFDPKLLDTSDKAQAYVIMQQAFNEIKMELRDDVDIVVSDRSVIDFGCYMDYCIKDNTVYRQAMNFMINQWARTYKHIYVVEPLPWVDDGKRPDDKFRMNIDKMIKNRIKSLQERGLPITVVDCPLEEREEFIANDIRKKEGK